ncbi:precorrin-2 dehydrogenase/sirohydrochlorin ferrochelatase family protein [Jiulongibacter sediminis]|uniref:precorrin-2 dehydrogenase n=1 Tax=Jiulongibacter sediminis TaxID=1605367 RepID=A0A0P7BYM6_9BACT|nr:bifunctional precorrin-2 dehydrogenase/sirohydrochlorin ferrochelatase [Jiulongibacter sediminis]KPM46658.1 siroheme synthase [Jiulongibacter sediminis]TBX21564.1 siroheme synthase [Jiulongibacter sediminis]
MNNLFPVFLKLEQMQLLIVGGGYVGLEKLEAVLKNSPDTQITLVAPDISSEIQQLAQKHKIELLFEPYQRKHLDGKNLVIVGTGLMEVSQQVQKDCRQANILVNVADKPSLCDFYLSSTVKKGDLKIAISTNGKSPTFAKRFREILEEILPDSLQQTLDNLQSIRNRLKGDFEYKVEKLNEITNVMKNDKN